MLLVGLLVIAGLVVTLLVSTGNTAVLNPGGVIADREKDLIIFTTLLGVIVIIPVYLMLFLFAWRYRASNTKRKAKYTPDVGGNWLIEIVWWGIPLIIIIILAVVTWISTHELDPYKKIASDKTPLKVQVVAMEWKWLFLYPDKEVASVNELWMPVDTPVEFSITADAPMSTFWIPNLGSQIYAMKGMTTHLNLMAHTEGDYFGTNTNINGSGYSKMTFVAKAVSEQKFDEWVESGRFSDHLYWLTYETLAEQSIADKVAYYHLHEQDLFDQIVAKYMTHGTAESHAMIEDMENR